MLEFAPILGKMEISIAKGVHPPGALCAICSELPAACAISVYYENRKAQSGKISSSMYTRNCCDNTRCKRKFVESLVQPIEAILAKAFLS